MDYEIWKPVVVPGYEEYYEVSSLGRIRRVKTGRILKQPLSFDGYPMVCLSMNNKIKYFSVHRLVAMAFITNFDNKPQVNHIDGNKLNNAVENLEWCTRSENMQHAWRTGLNKGTTGITGKHHTEETRRKMSESLKGHEVSQETRRKMSESQRRRWQKQEEIA